MLELIMIALSFSAGALVSNIASDRVIKDQRRRYEKIVELQNEGLDSIIFTINRISGGGIARKQRPFKNASIVKINPAPE